jgi:MFS family permease
MAFGGVVFLMLGGVLTGWTWRAPFAIGGMVALPYGAARARLSFPGVMSLSFSWMATGFVIIALAPSWPGVWFGAAVAGAGWGWTMPNLNTWLLAGVAPGGRGQALGLLTSSVFVGQFAAPLAAQPLIAASGIDAVFWATAGVLVLVAVALRRVPRRQPEPGVSTELDIDASGRRAPTDDEGPA